VGVGRPPTGPVPAGWVLGIPPAEEVVRLDDAEERAGDAVELLLAEGPELAERIKKLIEDQGGTVSQVQDWGVRELAYLIGKQRRAFYALFEYRSTSK